MLTSKEAQKLISDKLNRYFATNSQSATEEQMYKAVSICVRDLLLNKKNSFNAKVKEQKAKRVYYLCMEFLLGRQLRNNICNLGIESEFKNAVKAMGFDLAKLYTLEDDPGLGNGGLGRLAACFMDSLASMDYPALGFTLRYEYGLFKQKIVENQQVELPDNWMDSGEVWLMPRSDKTFKIRFGGKVEESWETGSPVFSHIDAVVLDAVPYDLMVSGADSEAVTVLRLWKARAATAFDMRSFSQGDYIKAMQADAEAEMITKVLYPSDEHVEGKQLRLNQQYFLVSASLQNIIKDHLKVYPSLDNLPDKVAIHINDTHPAFAIPELMRLLMDEYNYGWDAAWEMTTRTIAYTNHTVLAEALERWNENLVARQFPRIYMIINEINRRFCAEAWKISPNDWEKSERVAIISHGQIRMANLSVVGSHKVNGVSALHSEIIRNSIFKDFNDISPNKFTNVTNGIAHRRWLTQSNPKLAALIDELIGHGYYKNAAELLNLRKFEDDKSVLQRLDKIKYENKVRFSNYIKETQGIDINPESRFDTQIKRLHEYKRQLLNVLKIIYLYNQLLENPDTDMTPQTFVFGAKAAASYYHAKRIIQLINAISSEIKNNPKIKEKLNVVFVENYNVTKAEILIPASEVSEQISLAGKEASGTGNMKFMLNGAVTLGTVDGANVEILESVGEDNIFIFGLREHEVEKLWHFGYYATEYYAHNPNLRQVVELLNKGFDGSSFADIASYLIVNSGVADPYMCMADFNDYVKAHNLMCEAYRDRPRWNKMALRNIAEAGRFAADRSIEEYARDIWGLTKVK